MFSLTSTYSTLGRAAPVSAKKRASRKMNAVACRAQKMETRDVENGASAVSFGQKSVASLAALSLFLAPVAPAFAADKAALQEKGHAFAEASADVSA